MNKLTGGMLIALEGIDGSGKSLLAKNLYQEFLEKNLPVVLTKEPGGSLLGKQLRTILQEQTVPVCPKSEFLLFAADRAQHFETIIIPALNKGNIVISDRLSDSSLAYQGYGRGLDLNILQTVNNWTMNNITPDIVLYVRVDIETAFQRLKNRNLALTAFEKERKSFFETLQKGYEEIFAGRTNVITLDGTMLPEQIKQIAVDKIITWMQQQ